MLHVNRSRSLVGFLAGAALAITGVVTFQALRADAIGDDETTFVPITSCRLIDTRPLPERVGPFDAFAADDTKTIVAHGTNGACTIPAVANGLSLNVTALHATAVTYLTFWDDGTRPKASSLNPAPGQPPTPNAVNVLLSDTGTFQVYNAFGTVNVIIDITGYYTNSGLQDLTASLPVTASGFTTSYVPLGPLPTVVVAATLRAPGDGKVTVTVSANTTTMPSDGDQLMACSITTGTTVSDHVLYSWQPYGGPMSGVRVFDVEAGQTATYRLVCETGAGGTDTGEATNAYLSAIFTPGV